jgi:pimeloyl-ACP methyl ester carboxylesterase
MGLTTRVQAWQRRGERVPVSSGHRLFVVHQPGEQPPIVLLHGFPSSSYDWRAPLDEPRLREREVLAFDFLGFGLSDKPAQKNSLMTQADLAQELVARFLPERPLLLVAHDMGTSVATELFAREIEGAATIPITRALLLNGSMLLHLAKPTIGQQLLRSRAGPLLARLSSERVFRQQLGSVFSVSHPLSAAEAADQWSLFKHLNGHRRGHDQVAYMEQRLRYAERWHGALRDWPGQLSLLWGLKDPVARVEVLRGIQDLRPGVAVTELPYVGHYPQIEDPPEVAQLVGRLVSEATSGRGR